MSGGKNQRALLVEILIAVLFFSLCATVLLQTFMAARENSRRAGVLSMAMVGAQSLCEELYAAEDMPEMLKRRGFAVENDVWMNEYTGYSLRVTLAQEEKSAGMLYSAQVEAATPDETLLVLPCTRYIPGEATP